MAAKESIISVKGLSVSYDKKRVLINIHLDVLPGHLYGVVGQNGAGKSTLFKAILGLIEINAGEILVKGQPIQKVRKQVVYVPQKSDVDWNFPATVMDVVLMGRYPHVGILQRLTAKDRQIALNSLKQMGIEDLMNRQIGELSGGQQQRVFLARALCQEAEILFLDEPFVGVDITTEESIIRKLKQLSQAGKTILVIHHDLSTVQAYFDKTILINQRLVGVGDTEKVFTSENIARAYTGQLPILHRANLP